MVLPQGTQILRKPHDTLARVLNRPAAEIRIRRLEPARPSAQIHQQTHTNHLEECGDAVTHQCRQTPLVQTHNTASINIPEHRQQTHRRNKEQRIPLHTHRGTGTHTGSETPQAQTHARAPRHRRKHTAILACRLRNMARQHAPRLNTVKHQTRKSRQNPEHLENIQQSQTRLHQHQTIHSSQQRRNSRHRHRTEQQPANIGNQRHRQGANHRSRNTPTKGIIITKNCHARGNHPLTQRRMHHILRRIRQQTRRVTRRKGSISVLRPAQLIAIMHIRVGILGVVRLIKNNGIRMRQIIKTQNTGNQHNQCRRQPTPTRGTNIGNSERIQQRIEAVTTAFRRRTGRISRTSRSGRCGRK